MAKLTKRLVPLGLLLLMNKAAVCGGSLQMITLEDGSKVPLDKAFQPGEPHSRECARATKKQKATNRQKDYGDQLDWWQRVGRWR